MGESKSNGLLVLLSAPSGGGKTTLCQQIVATHSNAVRAVTCTTRAPRPGERDGVDYYFLDEGSFRGRIEAGEFLEHALVHGNWYGTQATEVLGQLAQGRDVLLSVDVQGAQAIREKARCDPMLSRALVTVFVMPASLRVLEERLRKRGTEAPEVVQQRLSVARQEIAEWRHYDYLILSTSIAEDLRRLQSILDAEKLRSVRWPSPPGEPPGLEPGRWTHE